MADARDAVIAELRQMNEQLGRLVAQQQAVIAAQQKLIGELEQRLAERDAAHATRAEALEAEVRRLERELFGAKTERIKIPPPERDTGEGPADEEQLARRREEAARKRRENALAKQQTLATDEVFYPIPDEQKRCPKCNGTRFGELKAETSTTIEYIPGRFVRRTHRREKLACSCGECILVAPSPPKLIPGGQYGFGFAAFLIVEKCVDSIPIHRIERGFQRLGIPISRATMNDWSSGCVSTRVDRYQIPSLGGYCIRAGSLGNAAVAMLIGSSSRELERTRASTRAQAEPVWCSKRSRPATRRMPRRISNSWFPRGSSHRSAGSKTT